MATPSTLPSTPQTTFVTLPESEKRAEPVPVKRDWRFWAIIVSLGMCNILFSLEFSTVATAMPRIAEALPSAGGAYIWVGTAYNLGSTVLLPLCGGLSQIFGRKAVMLAGIALFILGSALCGAAKSMDSLLGGRTVQGIGGGVVSALIQIIVADLVPLKDRGTFNGILALCVPSFCDFSSSQLYSVYALSGSIGPVVSGALAEEGKWRWLFYMSLPISGCALALVVLFLHLKTPPAPPGVSGKLLRLDVFGNAILIGSTTAITLALTWGGVQYAWDDSRVLACLVIGVVGLGAFVVYEALVPQFPIVPIGMIMTRTSLSGYAQNFLNALILSAFSFWLPLYFQACKLASPIASGVDFFGGSQVLSPSAALAGFVIQRLGRYRLPMWCGWVFAIIGAAALGHVQATPDSPRQTTLGLEALLAVGVGINYLAGFFPILAPIPVAQNAAALAFFIFTRHFGYIWGVTIGGAILQNRLVARLPASFVAQFPASGNSATELAFEVIPLIRTLPQPLQDEVRQAFASAFSVVWFVLAGVAGLGLLISFAMKGLPLHTQMDEAYGRADAGDGVGVRDGAADAEKA
ncbi:MFS general substrate transporter [Mycena chlorophos]|uniref:MFS general substrate transporter n=1 Tax=Mycena chlorophos TaxID=658473 RepID=A0A8H6T298_MYCCL|nr:MFS general substrate transporter [Mycena chlorophos]